MKAAAEYEIERAELNARLSLSIHQQLEIRAFEYCSTPNNQEVVTGYPETIAPLVMDPSRLRRATCAITEKPIISNPETLDTTYNNDEVVCSSPEHSNNELGLSTK